MKLTLVRGVLVLLPLVCAAASESPTNTFGFTGPEIFPIDPQISLLRSADFDGDGLNDLVVVNNSRSKINLLYNRRRGDGVSETPGRKRELNELPPDARLELASIASEKRIASLVVADLNGDSRPDLAYYGEPKELIVLYNEGKRAWSAPKRWPIADGLLEANALVEGDLDGNGRIDLLLVAENYFHVLRQGADGSLGEPERLPYTGPLKAVQILDVDGDGRRDVLQVNWDSPQPFRLRLQLADGRLAPEQFFTFTPIRSYWAEDLDHAGNTDLITIAQKSGRAQLSHFRRRQADVLSEGLGGGAFEVLPLARTAKAKRGVAWGRVDGDALPDLVYADPESGQLILARQQADGTLGAGVAYPTLTGVSEVQIGDWDGDGKAEVFVLSQDERQVGVSRPEPGGSLPFPSLVKMDGRPLAMALGGVGKGEGVTLAVVVERESRRELMLCRADGGRETHLLAEGFKSNPSGLAFHDVNQDGLQDLVVLIPYEKIKVLLRSTDRGFRELDVVPPGGTVEQPWMSAADVDGDGRPELLLAQKNFVRAVLLPASGEADGDKGTPSFTVKDQINGAGSNSRIVGAAALAGGTNRVPSLFLLDAERKVLSLCERGAAGVWDVKRSLPLPVTDFLSLEALALGSATPNSVGFLGLNAVAWMRLGGEVWELSELDGYETPIKDGFLHDVVSGDLNQDGREDLVFLETGKGYLDVVTLDASHRLIPANRWPVFEERTFRGRRAETPEPREALVTDVTGDGRNDLVVLVHDRILIYPQQ